jgi:DNA-binding PadR family transcriptional regulator
MSIKFAVLGLLADGPLHGYALQAACEKRLGDFWDVSHGQVYQILTSLERGGLVVPSRQSTGNRPRRKVFAISAAGREALRAWLVGPPERSSRLRQDLYLRLLVARGSDAAIVHQLIGTHVTGARAQLAELVQQRKARRNGARYDHLIDALCVDAAVLQAEATLKGLERCRAILSRLHAGAAPATLIAEVASATEEPPRAGP